MSLLSRRNFIISASGLAGLAWKGPDLVNHARVPLLSFSTLGCPDWTFAAILDFAAKNHYDGIEIRGIQRQLDLSQTQEFRTAENTQATKKSIDSKGLRITDLGSSCELHHTEAAVRTKNLDEGKRFIELAEKLNCPNVRVFPNKLPDDDQRNAILDWIVKGLLELGDFAKGSSVSVLLESHGDAVKTAELKKMMKDASHPNVGLVWDICNMWSVTREAPSSVYAELKDYIRHTHIKDANWINGEAHYTLLGKGEVPIFEAIDLLYKDGYKGYYSFEWEKLWHPEIDAPEIALADYPRAMKQHFGAI